jgi:hypothetical protein
MNKITPTLPSPAVRGRVFEHPTGLTRLNSARPRLVRSFMRTFAANLPISQI